VSWRGAAWLHWLLKIKGIWQNEGQIRHTVPELEAVDEQTTATDSLCSTGLGPLEPAALA
jgi:hypothetical protein